MSAEMLILEYHCFNLEDKLHKGGPVGIWNKEFDSLTLDLVEMITSSFPS